MKAYMTPSLRAIAVYISMMLLLGTTLSAQRNTHASSHTRINTSKLLDTKNVDVVYISPSMIENVPKASLKIDGDPAMSGIMACVTSIHIYSSSDRKAIYEIRKTFAPIIELKNSDLEQLMYVKDEDGVINVVGQMQGNIATEIYMIVSNEDEYTVINFSGNFSRRQLEEAIPQDRRKHK